MLKKIKFYQGKGSDGKYSIPSDLEAFVAIADEGTLKSQVEALVAKEMKNDYKKM